LLAIMQLDTRTAPAATGFTYLRPAHLRMLRRQDDP
jgi:hypothetical protein